jgi:hypothetical protein
MRRISGLGASLISISLVLLAVGCGGGSGSTQGNPPATPPPPISTLTLNPTVVMAGNSVMGKVTLSAAAPSGGALVTLTSANTGDASIPQSVTVLSGSTSATFTVSTPAIPTNATVKISGSYNGTASATLTINAVAALGSVTIKPNAPVSGNMSTVTVASSSAAPTGGLIVGLSSSNSTVASVPTSVTISAGSTTTNFTITAGATTNAIAVIITAKSANTQSATLTINPAATVNWSGGPGPTIPVTNQCFRGDFNGDGKADLACYTGGSGSWNVQLSTGSGWQSEFWNGGPGPALPLANQCFEGDFDGDGKTDLACYTGGSGSWNIALSTGMGWQSEFWNGGPGPALPVTNSCFTGDFNGDGKTDLACDIGGGSWNVALSTGSGWDSELWNGGPGPATPVTDQCFTGDFNGDGKTDLACWTGEGGLWNVALSTGSGWQSEFWNNGPSPVDEWNVLPVGGQCFAADFNGDKKTDITCPAVVTSCGDQYGCTNGNWNTSFSTGSGWNVESWNGGPGVAMPVTDQCFSGDFNGDGKADLACFTGFAGGVWGVSLSTASGWESESWNGGPAPTQEWDVVPVWGQCFAADFNGDGKTDLACYLGDGSSGPNAGVWSVALSTGSGW